MSPRLTRNVQGRGSTGGNSPASGSAAYRANVAEVDEKCAGEGIDGRELAGVRVRRLRPPTPSSCSRGSRSLFLWTWN
ncbi:hypothetical protein GUJ93_ZPchr0002g25104 [Zizania palustris]|uniref:Uncharacterized protein n=1 Tax=Zizania palustris TaxID=103762 RepID=A0A8J5V590_ZIZPA|nr:hypothetical protein GUJ93_ZPchr0002g25104 [Zizania palustris]